MYFIAGYGQTTLRGWGYVFWDMERLDRWDIFGTDWLGVEYAEWVEADAREVEGFKDEVERKAKVEGIERGLC